MPPRASGGSITAEKSYRRKDRGFRLGEPKGAPQFKKDKGQGTKHKPPNAMPVTQAIYLVYEAGNTKPVVCCAAGNTIAHHPRPITVIFYNA